MLTAEQADWLYQLMLAESGGTWEEVTDPGLTAEVEQVAARLSAKLPRGIPPVSVAIVTGGLVNAVTLPGGHVLITRPLISLMRNEDELAGVLAHEMGHIYTRDDERSFAAYFRGDLGLSDAGATEEAFAANYQRWITWRERHPSKVKRDDDESQFRADAVAIALMRLAGYDPRGLPDGFDRLAGTHGDTGNWFSNFFGSASPDSKRLRRMVEASAQSCAAAGAAPRLDAAAFQQWQDRLVAYEAPAGTAKLPGLISSQALEPLQDSLRQLKFSPDGRYILARDAAGVWVLTAKPLALALHVEEPAADHASFTPDSSGLVFSTSDGRVERWDIAGKRRTLLRQVVPSEPGCAMAAPSPDAASLACERSDGGFQLLDVETGAVRYERKPPPEPHGLDLFVTQGQFGQIESLFTHFNFTPGGGYLAVTTGSDGFVLDLTSAKPLSLGGSMQGYLNWHFSFLSSTEALGSNDARGVEWHRVQFPSGKEDAKFQLANVDITPVTHGSYLISRPMNKKPAGVVDPATHLAVLTSGTAALDGYDDDFIAEGASGAIFLDHNDGKILHPIAHLQLPTARLYGLSEGEASPDLRLLALSERRRGAVWDLEAHRQLSPVNGFSQAWMSGTNLWLQFFPAPDQGRATGAAAGAAADTIEEFDLVHGSKHALPHPPKGERDYLGGRVTVVINPGGQAPHNRFVLEMRDTSSGKTLWSKTFDVDHGLPALQMLPGGARLLLAFSLDGDRAKGEAAADPAWRAAAAAVSDRKQAVWFDLVNAENGAVEHSMLLDPAPSISLAHAFELDGLLYLNDGNDRTLAYELATGKLRRVWFGNALERIPALHAFVLHPGPRRLALIAHAAATPTQDFAFPEDPIFAQASADGQRLLVVTRGQSAYVLRLPDAVQ